jgi:hypothetical protein
MGKPSHRLVGPPVGRQAEERAQRQIAREERLHVRVG